MTVDPNIDFYNETMLNVTNNTVEMFNTITVNINPFYFNIHEVNDTTKIHLTTMGMNLIVTNDFTLYGFS